MEIDDSLLAEDERNRERIHILLDRYGILFRLLLERELPTFHWQPLFRTMRLMELSGELISGCFFEDLNCLQFTSPERASELQNWQPEEKTWWHYATDPASLCGIPNLASTLDLPRRIDSNIIVWNGTQQILLIEHQGKTLTFQQELEDINKHMLAPLHHLLRSSPCLTIKAINNIPAAQSSYLTVLKQSFDVVTSMRDVTLYRKH